MEHTRPIPRPRGALPEEEIPWLFVSKSSETKRADFITAEDVLTVSWVLETVAESDSPADSVTSLRETIAVSAAKEPIKHLIDILETQLLRCSK